MCDFTFTYEFGPGSGSIHELELDKDQGLWGKWEITSHISLFEFVVGSEKDNDPNEHHGLVLIAVVDEPNSVDVQYM